MSPYGVHDLAGNVWEWVADCYDKDYYQRAPDLNPPGPPTGQSKVRRGGSWSINPIHLRTARRSYSTPDSRSSYLGFRCAKGVP
ncbi:MAG: SUMF1/EgtB/PvdO family nonheme iron enzyme [Deltaproteobacteria bacterium]|nr:SUMF1/EgtB/PvdO family nonheme iron enzyme [Deltaproteobacteria bacterium]